MCVGAINLMVGYLFHFLQLGIRSLSTSGAAELTAFPDSVGITGTHS